MPMFSLTKGALNTSLTVPEVLLVFIWLMPSQCPAVTKPSTESLLRRTTKPAVQTLVHRADRRVRGFSADNKWRHPEATRSAPPLRILVIRTYSGVRECAAVNVCPGPR